LKIGEVLPKLWRIEVH